MRNSLVILVALIAAAGCGNGGPTDSGPPIALITLSAPSSSVQVGQTLALSAEVRDVNGDLVTTALTWQSSATNLATVSGSGVVTGRAAGIVKISAKHGGVKDSLEIAVVSNNFDVNTAGELFLPFSLTVPVGATVRFNLVDEHDVHFTAVTGAPPNILITSNMTVPRTFNTRGTFPYLCEIHPGMAGEIVVQ